MKTYAGTHTPDMNIEELMETCVVYEGGTVCKGKLFVKVEEFYPYPFHPFNIDHHDWNPS